MTTMQLSKSDYTTYLKHPAWLWLKKHDKAMLPAIDANTQAMFDTGHEFEQYAEALFPDGVTLGFNDYDEYKTLPARTTTALEGGEKTIFQGRFEADQLTFICDIVQVVGDREVDLYEIKSSTSAKPEHNVDLAFQMVVLEKCGYTVRNSAVIHVNNSYERQGSVEPDKITQMTFVTKDVKGLRKFTLQKIDEALEVMGLAECPDTSPLLADSTAFREWGAIYKHIKKTQPGSIYDLCRLNADTLKSLQDADINLLKDIPENFDLKTKQVMQVQAAKNGVSTDTETIQEFLSTFEFPLYFLDYETMGGLVPHFDGMRPYQQLPFQYSLHILDSPDAELRHEEYLHRDNTNPAQAVADALRSHIGDTGTVLAWNMGFEKACNKMLGKIVPEQNEFLKNVNMRMDDLMIPFLHNMYVDAGFRGSSSIKNVLPVLVPKLSYKTLGIQEGGTAQRLWMEAVLDGKHDDDKAKILDDLIEYCGLDTLAMVEIYNVLKRI